MTACRSLLGTYVEIRVDHPDAAGASAAMAAGFAAIERVQGLMSAFDPDSDIGRINRLAHRETVPVDAWTRDILELAIEIHAASDGLFDCGIAPQLAAWGILPTSASETPVQSSLANLHLCADGVRCTAPTHLDLGGIAKGYAVDRAADALVAAGASGGMINAGGDLRVFGDAEESIFLRDPGHPETLRFAGRLSEGACATSGTYFSRRQHDGSEISALVHPHTRLPLTSRRSYSIIAPLCVVADALTKVLALSENPDLPCFTRYSAHPLILDPS